MQSQRERVYSGAKIDWAQVMKSKIAGDEFRNQTSAQLPTNEGQT